MIINHNMASLNTYRQMSVNESNTSKSLEKLSSGLRINKAGDDAAGLAISEKMRGQIRGLDQAARNGQDGISLIQTAEGALNETHSILQRMRELAVQSSNDTNTSSDRSEIQKEVDELAKEITRISNNTEFNTQKLINGGVQSDGIGAVKFHVGANAGQDITLSINAMDAASLGVSRDKVATATGTASAVNIASATFAGDMGAGVVDGAVLSFAYTGAVVGNSATAAQWNSGAVTAMGDGVTNTFSFNGVTVSVTTGAVAGAVTGAGSVSIGIANGATADTTAAAILTAVNAYKASGAPAGSELDNFTFGGDGAGITIAGTGADGDANNALVIGGTIGVTTTAATINGVDAVAAQSAKVTITSDLGHTQTVNVTGTDTSLAITTGNFEGMTLTTATNIATDLNAVATVTIAATSDVASAAIFSNGALTTQATTEAGIDVSTQANASAAITTIQSAIETVSAERSKLGASQNRLEHTISNLNNTSENITAAESRIRDVDMAKEMMNFQKNNILQQAAQAMLAQANQQPQGVLQLLR